MRFICPFGFIKSTEKNCATNPKDARDETIPATESETPIFIRIAVRNVDLMRISMKYSNMAVYRYYLMDIITPWLYFIIGLLMVMNLKCIAVVKYSRVLIHL